MKQQSWTKKDKILSVAIFTVAIAVFVVFFSTVTFSYFFDTTSLSDTAVAGYVSIETLGGPNNDGKIKFPEVITPNTSYAIDNTLYMTGGNYNMGYSVKNNGQAPVYVMVKLEGEHIDLIRPTSVSTYDGKYWAVGQNFDLSKEIYMYYMTSVEANVETAKLCDYWQVGNFDNLLAGKDVKIKITAYAVQSQGQAASEMIAGNIDGWQYAPALFKDMVR